MSLIATSCYWSLLATAFTRFGRLDHTGCWVARLLCGVSGWTSATSPAVPGPEARPWRRLGFVAFPVLKRGLNAFLRLQASELYQRTMQKWKQKIHNTLNQYERTISRGLKKEKNQEEPFQAFQLSSTCVIVLSNTQAVPGKALVQHFGWLCSTSSETS